MRLSREELENLWKDPRSWKWFVIYHCPKDPRVIVPKRLRWTGYTVNFAHSASWIAIMASVILLTGPLIGLIGLNRLSVLNITLAVGIPILALILFCHWESSGGRFK